MSDAYIPERGYWTGPTLEVGESACPMLWEQRDGLDDCPHVWERVVIRFHGQRDDEPMVRCRNCASPRCGDSTDVNPCMERRHHRTVHIRLDGEFDPVGGYLREGARERAGGGGTESGRSVV